MKPRITKERNRDAVSVVGADIVARAPQVEANVAMIDIHDAPTAGHVVIGRLRTGIKSKETCIFLSSCSLANNASLGHWKASLVFSFEMKRSFACLQCGA